MSNMDNLIDRLRPLQSQIIWGLTFVCDLVLHPTTTFQKIRDLSATTVFTWSLRALAIYTAGVTTLAYTGLAVTVTPTWLQCILGYTPVYPAVMLLPLWLLVIIVSYLGTILYLTLIPAITLRVVYGRKFSNGFAQACKAIASCQLVWLLVGWIPLIGTIASVPLIVYEVIGIRELNAISTQKAILAVFLVPAILAVAIVTIFSALAIAPFFST
jgi:hypothetical protein